MIQWGRDSKEIEVSKAGRGERRGGEEGRVKSV